MQKKKAIIAIVPLALLVGIALLWWQADPEQSKSTTLQLFGNVDIREAQLAFNS